MKTVTSIAALLCTALLLSGCAAASLGSAVVDTTVSVATAPVSIAGSAVDTVAGGDDEDDEVEHKAEH